MALDYGFRLSPSSVSGFYSFNCERYFILKFLKQISNINNTEAPVTNSDSVSNSRSDDSTIRLTQNSLKGDGFTSYAGYVWENLVIKSLELGRNTNLNQIPNYQINRCPVHKGKAAMNPVEFMRYFDKTDSVPVFLYQPSYNVEADVFLGYRNADIEDYYEKKYSTEEDTLIDLAWSKIMPDFILIEKNEKRLQGSSADMEPDYIINVIDVKLAKYPHLSHKMQVALYVKLLNQFMKEYCNTQRMLTSDRRYHWQETDEDYMFKSPNGKLVKINNNTGYVYSNRDNIDISTGIPLHIENVQDFKENLYSFNLDELDVFLKDFFENRICGLIKDASDFVINEFGKEKLHSVSTYNEYMEIMRKLAENASFCIGANCDSCGNQNNDEEEPQNISRCIQLGKEQKSVQLYPGMSRRAQIHIQEFAKKHNSDYGEGNLLSYDNLNNYISLLRTPDYSVGTEEYIEDMNNKKRILDELTSNYSWSKYASFNNFHTRIVRALDYRRDELAHIIAIDPLAEDGEVEIGENNIQTDNATAIRNRAFNSMQLPKSQDVALFMSLYRGMCKDGKEITYLYRLRMHIKECEDDAEGKRQLIQCLKSEADAIDGDSFDFFGISEDLSVSSDLGDEFIERVSWIISLVSDYNKECGVEFNDGITLQGYAFDRNEYSTIVDFLFGRLLEILEDDRIYHTNSVIKNKIQSVLFWMQGDQLVSVLDEHPDTIMDVPVAIMLEEVNKLYEIPAYVSINLWNVCNALLGCDYGLKADTKKFAGNITEKINLYKVYRVNGNSVSLRDREGLLKYTVKRMNALEAILDHIQRPESGIGLYNVLAPFIIPDEIDADPLISKLLFERQNEFYLEYCEGKSTIMRSPASSVAAKKVIIASFEDVNAENGKYTFEVDTDQSMNIKSMFEAYLIRCRSLEEGRRALSNAFNYKALTLYDGQINQDDRQETSVFVISNIRGTDDGEKISFSSKNPIAFRARERVLIIEKPSAKNVNEELAGLTTINNCDDDAKALLRPHQIYRCSAELEDGSPVWLDNNLVTATGSDTPTGLSEIAGHNFVGTQWDAFKQLCSYNITLLQGPPGTGKTDYIGRSVVTLGKIALNHQGVFRILVGGFTHAAINNAVKKIYDIAVLAGIDDEIAFFKDKDNEKKGFQIAEIENIEDLTNKYKQTENNKNPGLGWDEAFETEKKIQVFGSTCWQAIATNPKYLKEEERRRLREIYSFDLVIIDEASQITVAQALFLMAFGKTTKTHYLIVGDNHQLPPIIRGKYNFGQKSSDIYSSIFNYYMDEYLRHQQSDDYLYSLNTEFRMNETLCNYSAKAIYNPQKDFVNNEKEYTAFNIPAVREQKIRYVDGWQDIVTEEWAREILDPDKPFAVVYLDGTISETVKMAEVDIVAKLSDYLEKIMIMDDGSKYFDFERKGLPLSVYHFWGGGINKKNKNYSVREKGIPEEELLIDTPAFGILSPYHKQINALTDKICADYSDKNEEIYGGACALSYDNGGFQSHGNAETGQRPTVPKNKLLIDTVNKLQGQEREAVIVSYGLYDPEEAIKQGEFIYNYQRLNVALTRGKKKTILILSKALSDKPIEMLDTNDEELIKGVSFLCDLRKYISTADETFECRSWHSDDAENCQWPEKDSGVSVDIYLKGLR